MITNYRASKRPSVKQVYHWDNLYEDETQNWKGQRVSARVECGSPFLDFYRVVYIIDGVKKSKLFYGETAHNDVRRFVYDLGLFSVDMAIL